MPRKVERRFLTAREAAAYLGMSLYTLKKIEHAGYIKPYRTPGGHRRYSQEMLEKYLEKSTGFSHNMPALVGKSLDSRQR